MSIEVVMAIPRQIPVYAVQYRGGFDSYNEVSKWIQAQERHPSNTYGTSGMSVWLGGFDNEKGRFMLMTDEGEMEVNKGDYILRGVKGEYVPCPESTFEKKYERPYHFAGQASLWAINQHHGV